MKLAFEKAPDETLTRHGIHAHSERGIASPKRASFYELIRTRSAHGYLGYTEPSGWPHVLNTGSRNMYGSQQLDCDFSGSK